MVFSWEGVAKNYVPNAKHINQPCYKALGFWGLLLFKTILGTFTYENGDYKYFISFDISELDEDIILPISLMWKLRHRKFLSELSQVQQ